jgi:D-amino-acid dehydrogenase
MKRKHVLIIGAGIAGISAAYYLNKAGMDVTVIDKKSGLDNCSYGNAGMIVPSHIIPLASPGIISKGLRWMLKAESPFYIKPRLSR